MWTPNPYYEKYLAHYGTKGMKWGVINEDEKDKMHRQMMSNTQKAQQAHRKETPGYGRGLMPKGGMDSGAVKQKTANEERRLLESRRDKMIEYLQTHNSQSKGALYNKRTNDYLIKMLSDAKTSEDMENALTIVGNILSGNVSLNNLSNKFTG